MHISFDFVSALDMKRRAVDLVIRPDIILERLKILCENVIFHHMEST